MNTRRRWRRAPNRLHVDGPLGTRETSIRTSVGATAAALAVAVTLVVSSGVRASATPAVTPGWPVPAPVGTVLPGPAGGLVVIAGGGGQQHTVSAFRRDGVLRWTAARLAECGNCDDGPQPLLRHPDGTVGPVGHTGDDYWAVDGRGRIVRGCAGPVDPGGGCIEGDGNSPVVVRRDGPRVRWRHQERNFDWSAEDFAPPLVVTDGTSTVYTAFDGFGDEVPGRLIALDAQSGRLRWRVMGVEAVEAALPNGVLASTTRDLVAVGPDGSTLWSQALPGSARTGFSTPARALVDEDRERIYLDYQDGGVHAIDSRTGETLWRTRASLLALGRSGTVYVGLGRKLRAIAPDGRPAWEYATATRVSSASELSDGTVALSLLGASDPSGGLVVRLDPRRLAPQVRRSSVALSRDRVLTRCEEVACDLDQRFGTTLEIVLRRPTALRVVFREPDGRPTPGLRVPGLVLMAPAGQSFVRILWNEDGLRPGRHFVEVTRREGARILTRRLPVRSALTE